MQQLRGLARHRIRIAIIAVILGAGLLAHTWINRTNTAPAVASFAEQGLLEPAAEDSEEPFEEAAPTAAADAVIVYVSGAVRAPDVYRLPAEARVKDLVLAAGGFAPDADTEEVNLAGRLKDEEHVHIPRQDEGRAESAGDAQTAPAETGGPIDLNTASAADLDGLPGIGQTLAERIVEHRSANGPFASVEDLRNVKGIGPALFAKIAPLVSVGP